MNTLIICIHYSLLYFIQMHKVVSYNALRLADRDSMGPMSNHGACLHSLRTRARKAGVLISAPLFTSYELNGRSAKNLAKEATMISVGTKFMIKLKLWRIAEITLGPTEYLYRKIRVAKKVFKSRQDIGEWWDDLYVGKFWNLTLPDSPSKTAVRKVTPSITAGNVNNTESVMS